MKSIPFYKSPVFMTAMLACLLQVIAAMNDPELIKPLLAADPVAISKLLGIVSTAGVALLRAMSGVQPLTMGQVDSSKLPALAAFALVPMLMLGGCQAFRDNNASAQLVSQYAVAKYLEGKKTDQARYDAAVRIIKIAADLKTVASGTDVQLNALRVYVGGMLAAQPLSPADRILANGLVEVLLSELEKRFKDGRDILNEFDRVAVNDVLSWVIAVAVTVPNPAVERPQ